MEKTELPNALDYVAVWVRSWKLIVFVPLVVTLVAAAIAYSVPSPQPVFVAYIDIKVAPEERAFFTAESSIAAALAARGADQEGASAVLSALALSPASADGLSRVSLSWPDPNAARTTLQAIASYFRDNSRSHQRAREDLNDELGTASDNLEAALSAVDYLELAVESLPPANELASRPDNLASLERATNLVRDYVDMQDKIPAVKRKLRSLEDDLAGLGVVSQVQMVTEQTATAQLGRFAVILLAGLLSLFLCLMLVSVRNALAVRKAR